MKRQKLLLYLIWFNSETKSTGEKNCKTVRGTIVKIHENVGVFDLHEIYTKDSL